jgi:hypothetical protein
MARRQFGLATMNASTRNMATNDKAERFEVFTAVTMKNGVFWDVNPFGSCKKRSFEGS